MNNPNVLLTTRQLQELLQIDRVTIYRMLSDGRIRGFKVGGQWRFPRQSVEAWLQKQQGVLETGSVSADLPIRPAEEALPLSCMQAIQDILAEALGVAVVTTTVDGNRLTPIARSCRFCTMILGADAGRDRCVASWRAAAARKDQAPLLSQCHAGLRYVWGRVEVQGEFVAAVHAGQFLNGPLAWDDTWEERISTLCQVTGCEPTELRDALAEVVVVDSQREQQIPGLVQRVATTFSEISEERLGLLNRLKRISEMTQI